MHKRGGTVWALSIDDIEAFKWERRKGFEVPLTFAQAGPASLEELGLLHQAGAKSLACPAVMLVAPGGNMLWARAGATNADRVPEEGVLEAIEEHLGA